jgi:hypothetical protein
VTTTVKRTGGGRFDKTDQPLFFSAGAHVSVESVTTVNTRVKKTAGGTFNPDDQPMYFAAGGGLGDVKSYAPPYLLVAVNELPTAASEAGLLEPILETGFPVLLDSGIFWLTNEHKRAHGCTMDEALALAPEEIDGFEGLYARYTELYHRYINRLWGVIELDQGGAVNKRRTRARLEADGIRPIPVYHPLNDGWDYFDELACGYDRICFGNIVQASAQARLRLLHTLWERHRAYPDLWVHVLGLTVSEQAFAFPFESCDSSTWISPLRWPAVRTESAFLHRTADLGPAFAYKVGSEVPGQTWDDGVRMCAEAIRAMNLVWREARQRVEDLTGQGIHPRFVSGERPPCASDRMG